MPSIETIPDLDRLNKLARLLPVNEPWLVEAQPTGIEHYPDFVQAWLSRLITAEQLQKLRSLNPKLRVRNVVKRPPRQFLNGRLNPTWVMKLRGWKLRLRAPQPTIEYLSALQEIERQQSILINYVEIARDECWQSRHVLEDMKRARDLYERRLWHQRTQLVRTFAGGNQNTYDGKKGKPRVMTRYLDEYCRITGELDCLHSEFRFNGVRSVKRAGITCVEDIISFNHVKWWQSKTRIVSPPDLERLGRFMRNRCDKTNDRRTRWYVTNSGSFTYRVNEDARLGLCMFCSSMRDSDSLQSFLDEFGVSTLIKAGVLEAL